MFQFSLKVVFHFALSVNVDDRTLNCECLALCLLWLPNYLDHVIIQLRGHHGPVFASL